MYAFGPNPAFFEWEASAKGGDVEQQDLADLVEIAQAQARSVPHLGLTSLRYEGVHILSQSDELTELFRLRRQLFQAEGARNYLSLSRDETAFVEPCDLNSLQVGYFENGALVYALRYQQASGAGSNPNYAAAWATLGPRVHAGDVLMTRFVNSAQAKRITGIYQLFSFCYHFALISGVRTSFLTCAADRTNFFSRIGYRTIEQFTCPHSGTQCVMQLSLHDATHLKEIRSPLHKVWTKAACVSPALSN